MKRNGAMLYSKLMPVIYSNFYIPVLDVPANGHANAAVLLTIAACPRWSNLPFEVPFISEKSAYSLILIDRAVCMRFYSRMYL